MEISKFITHPPPHPPFPQERGDDIQNIMMFSRIVVYFEQYYM
jgi:hypothetical protein